MLLDLVDRLTAAPGRAALRAWAGPRYVDGPLVRTPVRRVLALACAWLGDTLWDVQVLPALEGALPEAEVHVATRPRGAALVAHLPARRRHVLDQVPSDRLREQVDLAALAHEAGLLRGLGFDLVVDLTGNRYSALFTALARPRAALGFDAAPLGWAYTTRVRPPAGEHRARRPWRVVAPLTGDLVPPPPALPPGLAAGPTPAGPYALLAPGAGWPAKRWPAARFAALAGRLAREGLAVVVTGAAAERDLVAEVAAAAPGAVAQAADDLPHAAALSARARVVVANDSGLAHLAAAAGAPVVALFGPTNPDLTGPLGPRVTVLRAGCDARPTGGRLHCHDRPGHPCPVACWDPLTVDAVHEACRRALA
ncbi:MAG: glycosyltransferase family 9 protein [Planctomycetes bacterium]|nr:glycosyltransferase family 9 protein [Planctomycetota bacterium]